MVLIGAYHTQSSLRVTLILMLANTVIISILLDVFRRLELISAALKSQIPEKQHCHQYKHLQTGMNPQLAVKLANYQSVLKLLCENPHLIKRSIKVSISNRAIR